MLARDKFRKYLTHAETLQALNRLRALAVVAQDPPASDTAITADPDDDYLVLLAEAANVDSLV